MSTKVSRALHSLSTFNAKAFLAGFTGVDCTVRLTSFWNQKRKLTIGPEALSNALLHCVHAVTEVLFISGSLNAFARGVAKVLLTVLIG